MAELRNGMWVRCSAGVGIYIVERTAVKADGSRRLVSSADSLAADEKPGTEPWVHLTNADGTTLAQLPVAAAGPVVQASLSDIPASRVDGMTPERLAQLGYR